MYLCYLLPFSHSSCKQADKIILVITGRSMLSPLIGKCHSNTTGQAFEKACLASSCKELE